MRIEVSFFFLNNLLKYIKKKKKTSPIQFLKFSFFGSSLNYNQLSSKLILMESSMPYSVSVVSNILYWKQNILTAVLFVLNSRFDIEKLHCVWITCNVNQKLGRLISTLVHLIRTYTFLAIFTYLSRCVQTNPSIVKSARLWSLILLLCASITNFIELASLKLTTIASQVTYMRLID